jgi:hypothetical protein
MAKRTATWRWLAGGVLLTVPGCGDGAASDPGDPAPACLADQPHAVAFGPEDTTFWVGPYLGATDETSVAIAWESEESGGTLVEVGLDASYGLKLEGAAGTMHQLVIDGLEPGTTYHYRACTDAVCTADLTFSTAPRAGQPYRFAVLGDSRSDPATHNAVSTALVAEAPALVFNTGDIVEDGTLRDEFKAMHFDPTRQLGHYAPLFVSIGNHERKDTDGYHFIDYLMYPEDPGVPQAETSFSFVYGDAFFLVFDNTVDHADLFAPLGDWQPPLWLWLLEQVSSEAAKKARWRFAFTHYPADSVCFDEYGMPSKPMRDYVLPLLFEHGFQAHFAGHQHAYERFDFDGGLAITTGGGGAGLEDPANCHREVPEARVLQSQHHYMTVDLSCESAEIRAIDVDGIVFDRLLLRPDGSYDELTP